MVAQQAGGTTLWQGWCAVDVQATRRQPVDKPWPRVPDQLTLRRAMRWALKQEGQNRLEKGAQP